MGSLNSIQGIFTGEIPVYYIYLDDGQDEWHADGGFNSGTEFKLYCGSDYEWTRGLEGSSKYITYYNGNITDDLYQLKMHELWKFSTLNKRFAENPVGIIWQLSVGNGYVTYLYSDYFQEYLVCFTKSLTSFDDIVNAIKNGDNTVEYCSAGGLRVSSGDDGFANYMFFQEKNESRSCLRFGYAYQLDDANYNFVDSSISLPFDDMWGSAFSLIGGLNAIPVPEDENKKYGEYSTPGGYGGGSFDDSTDAIGIPELPTIGVTNTGFINVYNPTKGDLLGFVDDLFPDFVKPQYGDSVVANLACIGENIGNLLDSFINSNLIQYVIDCHIVPVTPITETNSGIKVGFKTFDYNPAKVTSDYVTIDCGTLSIKEYYQNFLDYRGTTAKLFLPFVGFVPVQNEWFQGGKIQVAYNYNVIDGSFMAFVIGTSSKSKLANTVVAQYGGNCCVHIPITGMNYSSMISGIVQGVSSITNSDIPQGLEKMFSKPQLEQSNGYNSASGYMGVRIPYLLIQRPVASFSEKYPVEQGLPLNVTKRIGDMQGFTKCENVEADNLICLDSEKQEIISLLTSGIIV